MNKQQIKDVIEKNLSANRITAEKVIVQPAPGGDWDVAVVSKDFESMTSTDRRSRVLAGLEQVSFSWVDLVTPDEAEWVGPLPGELDFENLPLWPESMTRARQVDYAETRFLADFDIDVEKPIVATFYSLRGGVGRSTSLAHTARILAKRHKVICVDMDLEAPALHVLFNTAPSSETQGVVDLLVALDRGETPDYAKALLPVAQSDNLFVLPAGLVNDEYARKLRFINPGAWYREERNPLRLLIEGLKHKLPFKPDIILLDARTGITDLSGPLLFDLAHVAIVAFFPHPQAKHGTELLVRSLLAAEKSIPELDQSEIVPELRFLVSPIPTIASKEIQDRYEKRPLDWITSWLEDLNQSRASQGLGTLDAEDITHFVRYQEALATADWVGPNSSMASAFEPIAHWIERFIPAPSELQTQESIKVLKSAVLDELSFSTGMAEDQPDLMAEFVHTETIHNALQPNVVLIRGRKGTGKTALFRYLSEHSGTKSVVVHAPTNLAKKRTWIMPIDGFGAINRTIDQTDLQWRHFWMLYIGAALENSLDLRGLRPKPLPDHHLSSATAVVDAFKVIADTGSEFYLADWLMSLDRALKSQVYLLFDGLDTGYGSAPADHLRRRFSIEGLFDAWMDLGDKFENLRFKILLREDIWKRIRFDNQSHLFGRSVQLHWDNTSFFKVVLKQAMRSKSFVKHPSIAKLQTPVDDWPEQSVREAWNVLVGERMRGAGTTYTRNWVWTRLADANEDHSPRLLLQLFHLALPWEKQEQKTSPYDKAMIRPRALSSSLPDVSAEALKALEEEFPELQPLLTSLRAIGRTPIPAAELKGDDDLITLAREVGLLGSYEEREQEVVRYKVPDLYRHALEMTRKGQI